jgi:hypothetical protein
MAATAARRRPTEPHATTGLDLDAGRTLVADLPDRIGQAVTLRGWVHHRRDLGGLAFLHLRDRSGVVQCVLEGIEPPLHESCVEVEGAVVAHAKAPGGVEVRARALRVITLATTPPPVEMAKIDHQANPDTLLEYRHVTVRAPRDRAVLKVQAELLRGFRGFLDASASPRSAPPSSSPPAPRAGRTSSRSTTTGSAPTWRSRRSSTSRSWSACSSGCTRSRPSTAPSRRTRCGTWPSTCRSTSSSASSRTTATSWTCRRRC